MKVERWMATIALLVGLPVAAAAQSDSGRISGSVRDQTSAFVIEATVTIKNDRTGEVRTTKTNADGYFLVSPLRPSTYTIKAEKPGFGVLEYPQMPLAVGQELALDFELKPAGVQETVNVVGTAPTLDISSARMGVNVSEREVQGLPVTAGRCPSSFCRRGSQTRATARGRTSVFRPSQRADVIKYDGSRVPRSSTRRGQRERREQDALDCRPARERSGFRVNRAATPPSGARHRRPGRSLPMSGSNNFQAGLRVLSQ